MEAKSPHAGAVELNQTGCERKGIAAGQTLWCGWLLAGFKTGQVGVSIPKANRRSPIEQDFRLEVGFRIHPDTSRETKVRRGACTWHRSLLTRFKTQQEVVAGREPTVGRQLGTLLNINADTVAAALAVALKAEKTHPRHRRSGNSRRRLGSGLARVLSRSRRPESSA